MLVQEKDANGLKRCVVKDVEEDSPGTFFFSPSLSSLSLLFLSLVPPPSSLYDLCRRAMRAILAYVSK
jgi:hypothetical protein